MSQGKTILLIDDEADLREAIKMKLEAEGYQIEQAANGVEALEHIKRNNPDLIVLDVMMPELNGYQVCKRLKEDEKLKHIPIILLTGRAHSSDQFWGLGMGANDYITKPFEFHELLSLIAQHLND
ncbi:MAG: response regulator [Deltaproteobacteria bacterium]|nr:response regulator [Deltaproteobacteria bacterium]